MFTHFSHFSALKINTLVLFFLFSTLSIALPIDSKDYNTSNSPANVQPWTIWEKNENVSVKFREVPNTVLIEIKAQVTVTSSLSGALLFLQDTTNITRWLENVNYSKVIENISAQENISKTAFDSFWPIKNREIIVRSRYWQNEDLSVEVSIEDQSLNYRHLITEDALPITIVFAHWKVTPHINNTITIEHVVIADPNGSIPSWITNRMALKSMWRSMLNVTEQLPVSSFQQQTLNTIKELSANR